MNKYQKQTKGDLENLALNRKLSINGTKKQIIERLLKDENSQQGIYNDTYFFHTHTHIISSLI